MGVKSTFMHAGGKLVLEVPGRRKSVAEWADALAAAGEEIDRRAAAAGDQTKAQKQLRHISGIERWGQSRLRVFLGEPPVMDEYDGYRPGVDLSTDEQRAVFRATREETVALARRLATAQLDPDLKVAHNDFGPLTPRGWLRYLDMHANFEMKKVRS